MTGTPPEPRIGAGQDALDMAEAVARLAERVGDTLSSWGPVRLDAVTIARFVEAVGLPPRDDADLHVPGIILAVMPRRPIDVHQDVRPAEQVDNVLGNPVNGGTRFEFLRPLRPGESIHGTVSLKEATLRSGRSGPLAIVVKRTVYSSDSGEVLARRDHTMIYRGQRK